MDARDPLTDLASYASPAHRRLLRDGAAPRPIAERFHVVSLFADISGFSALTSALGAKGPGGAETLSHILNERFGRLVDLVHAHDGEVLDFAGDAAIAFWPTTDQPTSAREVATRAVACAHRIREALEGDAGNGVSIRLRLSVGAGPALCALVGGSEDRWLTLMAGAAWKEMLTADASALPGEVAVAPSVARLLAQPAAGTTPSDAIPETAATPVDLASPHLRTGVPRAVQRRIAAGQHQWLAEFLQVTTLFLNVPGLSYDDESQVERLQAIALAVQQQVHRFDGSVNRLLADDKGTVLIAVWGVPLHTHEDDPARAVLAALAIRDALHALGARPAIGITTGRAFAGTVGNQRRRQYALLGDQINLAARLMQEAGDTILCDAVTRSAAHARVRFSPSSPRRLKGRDTAIDVSAALGPRLRTAATDIVNRTDEQRLMADAIGGLDQRGEFGLLVIQGEPGIGKSALVSVFLRRAQSSRVRVLVGASESIDRTSPYRAWRGIFEALLGLDAGAAAETRLRAAQRALGDDQVSPYLPLVSDALGLGLPASELTTALNADARAEAAREVLARLFVRACGEAPVALVLEDAHWMDSSSWSLAAALLRLPAPVLLIVVLRPIVPDEMSDDCRRLLREGQARTIDLDVLSGEEALALACRRLDVDALPEAVAVLVRERGEGHPLFTEQLVRALVERGVIRVEHHECHADPAVAIPELPETVQGLIRGRIDLLSAEEQLTLRIASVLGRAIDVDAVAAIHPLHQRDVIESQILRMTSLDLLQSLPGSLSVGYAFKHAIVREVAYGTLVLTQRREFHRAAAEWYERMLTDTTSAYALLARHWSEAGVTDKAMHYLERAAAQAFDSGNYRETIALTTEALAIANRTPGALTPLGRATWLRRAGQACYALGHLGDSRAYAEQASVAIGHPVPATTTGKLAGLVGGALRVWTRPASAKRLDPESAVGAELSEAARIVDHSAYNFYLANDTLSTAYCLVTRLDFCDRVALDEPAVASRCGVAYLLGAAGFRRRAERTFTEIIARADALQLPHVAGLALYSWSMLDMGNGNLQQARDRAARSAAIYRGRGDHLRARDSAMLQGGAMAFLGEWEEAWRLTMSLHVESRQFENLKQVSWACKSLAKIAYRTGRVDEAVQFADQGLAAAAAGQQGDTGAEQALVALRACARFGAGDRAGAAADVAVAIAAIDPKATPSHLNLFDAYALLAEAAIAMGDDRAADIVCAALRRSARLFPIMKPVSLLWHGIRDAERGRTAKARRTLGQALSGAERLSLAFERQHAAEVLRAN